MITHRSQIRVRYQETDGMGIVYHGNYLTWFEVARIDMLDALGLPYRTLEDRGFRLPVLEANARYHAPARFDDRLEIFCSIQALPRVKIRIDYIVTRNDKKLTTGYTLHAFMDDSGFAIKPPDCFMDALRPHFQTS